MFDKQHQNLRQIETANDKYDTQQIRNLLHVVQDQPTRAQMIVLRAIQTAMVLFAALLIYLTLKNW